MSQCEINFRLPSLRWDLITDFQFLVCFAFERGTWGVGNIWLPLSDLGSIRSNNNQEKRYGVLSCNLCQFLNYLKKYRFWDFFKSAEPLRFNELWWPEPSLKVFFPSMSHNADDWRAIRREPDFFRESISSCRLSTLCEMAWSEILF